MANGESEIHAKFVDLEWQQRNRLLIGAQRPLDKWARPAGDHINPRNRYANVVPFEQNRIKLSEAAGGNDYINASPISLGNRRYIATQGPLEAGVNHFYRMLDDQTADPAVVIMLTQTHESGKEKCYQYYPLSAKEPVLDIPGESDATDNFHGSVRLTRCEEDPLTRSQIRRMVLHVEKKDVSPTDKQIVHFLFSGWPDFLVPEGDDKTALIRLLEVSARTNGTPVDDQAVPPAENTNGESQTQPNPRIIHCSAGVGRSGTFIALDFLFGLLHAGQFDSVTTDWDPVADAVEDLRKQRMMMVQGEGQFFFIYDVLREQLLERLRDSASKS